MKAIFKSNFRLGFVLMVISLIHLPFVFAMPRTESNGAMIPSITPVDPTLISSAIPAIRMNGSFELYDSLQLYSKGLTRDVFNYAINGFKKIKESGTLANDSIISIVDFTKPSSQKRLFVIDLKGYKLLFNTYVAHGSRSGKEFASKFSNSPRSNKSSLGFYKTADTYFGKNGYSLHLVGLEKGFNDNAFRRDIVIHAADYVNEGMIRAKGCIGRSWGCPALPENLNKPIIEKIKEGSCLFIFGTDRNYLKHSSMLKESTHDLALK